MSLAARLGRVHAWRDRGNVYVDGLRTSAQASLLAAGVAKGADFAGTAWAVALGLGLFCALEGGKILAGYCDYRFRVMHEYQRIAAEANPVTMRQVAALERMVPPTPMEVR